MSRNAEVNYALLDVAVSLSPLPCQGENPERNTRTIKFEGLFVVSESEMATFAG